jgi:hypothetical protein
MISLQIIPKNQIQIEKDIILSVVVSQQNIVGKQEYNLKMHLILIQLKLN